MGVVKAISLLLNTLFRFVIAFLPRGKDLLSFMAAVTICSDFLSKKRKPVTVSTFSPFIYQKVMGLDAMILVF